MTDKEQKEQAVEDREVEAEIEVTLTRDPVTEGGTGLVFEVTSRSESRLCIYHTPLEGFRGNILEVRDANGKRARYIGISVKRSPPSERHYIALTEDESRSITFDLAQAYRLSGEGPYRVQFKGNPHTNNLPDSNVLELVVP